MTRGSHFTQRGMDVRTRRKNAWLVTVVAALALAVAGCGSKAPQPQQGTGESQGSTPPAAESHLAKVKAAGKLVVGTSADYPPYEFIDEKGNIVGFDVDLTHEITKELGVQVEIVNQNFDSLLAALQTKQFDMVAAGLTITEERKRSVDFSIPYFAGGQAIVVHKDRTDINSLKDLNGKSIAVQIGTYQEKIAKEKVQNAEVKSYQLFTDAAQAVATKQADAMIVAKPVAEAFAKQLPVKIVAEIEYTETALAFPKGSDLVPAVNQVLEKMKQDGRMKQLVTKWFK